MQRWVINQDRDEIVMLETIQQLTVEIVRYRGFIIGFNLNFGNVLLGTFDTLIDVLKEITDIINIDTKEFHVVSGYFQSNTN